ncbi:siderophore ABC transporter substrate-binding protein [Streptococcus moroccensis]|uniref:Iron complex transport system substrate-binding protein n=1 Tax=Streptococcus moroccensis TaxID=1451356 RepID=A0ABT9YTN0_9STRE|nr:siderophore ABC transporter substrate-binding protein [Streptococcus moroccensis]MDQ0223084.1 iron complex transport system substrate-binding protein [Streptococcus moroccensis]
MNNWLKKLSVLLVAMLTSFMLIACSNTSNTTSETTKTSETAAEVTIGDVTVPVNPQKIVTFDLGAADTIRAIGFEEAIVGLPTQGLPAYLSDLSDLTSVGNMKEPDLEAIAALEPDLIIASGRTADYVAQFSEIAPTIMFEVDNTDYWTSVKGNITALASIFGEDAVAEAEKQLANLDSQIADIASANEASDKKALAMVLNEGNMAVSGPNSRFAFLYSTLGFHPTEAEIEESRHGQEISFEGISEINPDLIFVLNRTLAIGGDNSSNESLLQNELVQATKAAQNDGIVNLTSDLWYLSGGGLESTQLMIDDVKDYAK